MSVLKNRQKPTKSCRFSDTKPTWTLSVPILAQRSTLNIQRLFTDKIEIYDTVQSTTISVTSGIIKIALKAMLESVRLKTFSSYGLQQIQGTLVCLQSVLYLWFSGLIVSASYSLEILRGWKSYENNLGRNSSIRSTKSSWKRTNGGRCHRSYCRKSAACLILLHDFMFFNIHFIQYSMVNQSNSSNKRVHKYDSLEWDDISSTSTNWK